MKSFRVCYLFICYTIIITVKGTAQEKNLQLQYGDAIAKYTALYCPLPLYVNGGVFVPTKTQFADLPQSAKARTRAVVNLGGKRGNQFKSFMMGRETSKDAVNQVQKGSYIPVKSNGKRENSSPEFYGIYTGSDDMDIFQKWLSSYYLP